MRHLALPLIVLVTFGTAALAQPQQPPEQGATPNTLTLSKGVPRPAAKIADLAWLAGTWRGEFMGGIAEEAWSAPMAGAMVGYFRLVSKDKPVFYEIMTLLENEDSVEMRLKHVNPDMTGWEEKNDFVTFPLVKHDESGVYFSGLTMKRSGADTIEGFIAIRNRSDGTVREEKFVYRRVP